MKFRLILAMALLVLSAAISTPLAQDDLSFYPVRTLSEALKDSVNREDKADFYMDGRQLKSRSKVTFTGELRKLTDKRRQFVELWLESRGLSPNVINVLEKEAKFQEGNVVYWMPIRKRTLDLIPEDMKKGGQLDVYTILAGAVRVADKVEPVFIVGGITQ